MERLDATTRIGQYVDSEVDGTRLRAYIPVDLPFEPPLQLGPTAQRLLQEAYHALGHLEGAAAVLPERNLLLYMYLRKEAVLSSQIEGTQSSLEEFLQHETQAAPGVPLDEVTEIANYVAAVESGMAGISQRGISRALLLRLHKTLLSSGRGSASQPGRIRTKQNLVGSRSRLSYVPPPPEFVAGKLANLIEYMNAVLPAGGALAACAVAHVQFESIHPFMDGNGRLGRMLILLLLCRAGVLTWPLLYISLYLKQNRSDYYALLTDVREHGDWESWTDFFLTAVRVTAAGAGDSIGVLTTIQQQDRERIKQTGRPAGSALQVYDCLLKQPLTDVPRMAKASGLSSPTVRTVLNSLVSLGICSEVSGAKRNRLYRYDSYIDILNAGTETP